MPKEVDLGSVMGPRGPTGPKGDTIFWLEVDSDGNLYAVYADEASPPQFEFEKESGNLYLIVSDDVKG